MTYSPPQADPSSVDIHKIESPNRFRRMTLPHAFNLAGSDLVKLRQSANFWAERAAAAAIPETTAQANHSTAKEEKKEKEKEGKEKEKTSRIGRRRASKPFKRSKTLMESS